MHYGHLVRRGVAAIRDSSDDFPQDLPPPLVKLGEMLQDMPQWGVFVLIFTVFAGLLLIASVRYTLQGVVVTLATVESPQTTVIVRDEKSKLEQLDPLLEDAIDSEVIVIKQQPITSSIKATIRHLQSRGGRLARWRGLSSLLVWATCYDLLHQVLMSSAMSLVSSPEQAFWIVQPIAAILSRVLLARLGLTWTHIVISEPSPKPWFRRVPSFKAFSQIAGPTAYTAAAWQLTFFLPAAVAYNLGLHKIHESSFEDQIPQCVAMKLLAVAGIALVTFIGITIPAEVALTRVQASLLSDEDETIVPMDRTFNGAVVPQIAGGSGKLGYVQAWRSFDSASRVRLLKLVIKAFAVDAALHLLVVLTLAMQLVVIAGSKKDDTVWIMQIDDSSVNASY